MVEDSTFLTVSEAARLLRLKPKTLYARIARGELDAVRVGIGPKAPIRIASGDLVSYLKRVNGG